MQIRSSGNKPPYRPKRYGLSLLGFNLLFALWLGLGALIGEQVDLPETGWVVASFFLGVFAPPIIAYFWDAARAPRLKKRDHDAAVTAIKQPLRNAQQLDGSVVDFEGDR